MINFNEVDFSECRSEEVMSSVWRYDQQYHTFLILLFIFSSLFPISLSINIFSSYSSCTFVLHVLCINIV